MTYDIRMESITCEVCGSKVKRYNWLKHVQTKTHKKKAKDEDLTHLAGSWIGNNAGNVRLLEVLICLRGRMRRAIGALTEINGGLRRTTKARRRSMMNERMRRRNTILEYAMRETDCLTCRCRVRKCKWRRHTVY